jgi:TPR repeat protein
MSRRLVTVTLLVASAFTLKSSAQTQQRYDEPMILGSGFLLAADGEIATNYHVVKDASRVEVSAPNQRAPLTARIVTKDADNDLAILRADGMTPPAIRISFAPSSSVKVGQDAFVLGYPLSGLLGSTVRLSTGSIDSLFGVRDDPRVFQISAAVQPGNSGGPVFNKDGQLIGVVVAQLDAGQLYRTLGLIPQNVNFAIKGDLLKRLVETLPGHDDIEIRPTTLAGLSRERQVEILSPLVVHIVSYRERPDTAPSTTKLISPARADYEEGQRYLRGDGVATDPSTAATLFQRACDNGEISGCVSVGFQYANGNGVKRDDARAVALYRKACDAQNLRGCADLGFMTETGRGVERDLPSAAGLYQKACDGGDLYGCSNLAAAYAAGRGVARDDLRSVALAQRACDGGYTIGCRRLASMYERGRGIAKDEVRAIALYQRACDGRDWTGCDDLGRMYAEGRGVDKNEARAVTLFQSACEGAYAPGCRDLARMYADGLGVAKDEAKAAAFYQKACDGANTNSCARLASMYEFGTGVGRDIKRAIELYQIACKANDQTSCTAATRLTQQ